MTRRLATLWLLLTSAILSAQQPAPAAPRLIVILVVDQMRTDYLERAAPHLTGGLKRLTTEGAWFTEGAYPYLNTVTCAGHSTIGTGAFPYKHGMVLNAWWERSSGRQRVCTADESVQNLGHTEPDTEPGDSARWIEMPTLGQKVHEAGGRTVAISLKSRAAIPLAGKSGTAVVWQHNRTDWVTSTAYTKAKLDWLERFIQANPIAAEGGKVWERALPADQYSGTDDAPGEKFPSRWTSTFPHAVPPGNPRDFISYWQKTPFADEYLGRMAASAADALQLGRRGTTDFLAVSFSTLDLVGHDFGPASHEIQDMVIRLDRTIGSLLNHLDAAVGRGRYVVALSADHGVGPMPEQTEGSGRQGGPQAMAAIDKALEPFFGPGKYAAAALYTDLYLQPGVLDKLKADPKASKAVLDALRALPAVEYAFRADEISPPETRTSSDPVKRAAALSHYPSRSGDLVIVPKRHWLLSTSSATTHGTLQPYDQRVPVIFYGAGVPAGRRTGAATPADITATLAALAGVTSFKAPDGKPLLSSSR